MRACLKLNRFYFMVMILWQFEQFFSCQLLFTIFATYVPRWRCSLSNNTEFEKNCAVYQECAESIEYENHVFYSVSQEFNWICGTRAYMSTLYSQLHFFAVLIGILAFGYLSDRLGRKPISILVTSLGITSLAISSLSTNWQVLLLSRFLVALSIGGKEVVCTYAMELILARQRMLLKAFNWGIARFLMTLFCFLFPNWRSSSFACASFSLPVIFIVVFILPESPVWLHNKATLEEIARSEESNNEIIIGKKKLRSGRACRNVKMLELLKNLEFLKRIVLLWVMWFCASFCGYLSDLNSQNMTGNLFVNQFLFSSFIAASKPFLVLVDSYWSSFGRRQLLLFTWSIVVVSFSVLTLLLSFKRESALVLVINVIGLVFIEFAWDVNNLCTIETMPTNMRATAMSSCSFMSRLGALLTPLAKSLNSAWPSSSYLSIVVVGLACLVGPGIWLNESKGVDLWTVNYYKPQEEKGNN